MTAPPQNITLPAARLHAPAATLLLENLGYSTALAMAVIADAHLYPGGFPLPGGHVVHWVPARNSFTICAADGPDLLSGTCYGDDREAVEAAALAWGRRLYGPGVPLAAEAIGTLHASLVTGSRAGRTHYAEVRVRCLDLPEGSRP